MNPIKLMVATLALVAGGAWAQSSPVGLWKTIDDETHKEKSYVRISDDGTGHLQGKVEKVLDPSKQDAKCDKCTDDRKGKPIIGMSIFSGAKQDADEQDTWGDTQILKPEEGKQYRLRLKVIDGGKKLQVRGYFGPFFKTQEWIRLE